MDRAPQVKCVIYRIVRDSGAHYFAGIPWYSCIDDLIYNSFRCLSTEQLEIVLKFGQSRLFIREAVDSIYNRLDENCLQLLFRIYNLDLSMSLDHLNRLVICIMAGYAGYFFDTSYFRYFIVYPGRINSDLAGQSWLYGRHERILSLARACVDPNSGRPLVADSSVCQLPPFNFSELRIFCSVRRATSGNQFSSLASFWAHS